MFMMDQGSLVPRPLGTSSRLEQGVAVVVTSTTEIWNFILRVTNEPALNRCRSVAMNVVRDNE